MDLLAKIEQERTERKELLNAARNQQRAVDMARLNELEIERGDGNIASVEVGRHSPGMVTMVVVRSLNKNELKRFRDRTKREGADTAAAAEEATGSTLLYPAKDSEEWTTLLEAVPGIAVRAGVAAVQLSAGLEQTEGK